MRRLRVTIAVDVTIPDELPEILAVTDDESAAGLVDTIARRALADAGLDPVSCGYGYGPSPLR